LSKRVQPEMFVSLSIDFSLQFCLYLCNSTESSRKFYRNVFNPKCLFPSLSVHFSLQVCLGLSSLIESSRKQILLRESYREQLRILSRAVANPVEPYVSLSLSLYVSLCLTLSLSLTCAYLNKASTGSELQTLSQETAVQECTAIYSL